MGSGSGIDALYRMVVASAHDAIIAKTLDGVVRTWNRAAEGMFGYSQAEMIGRPITMLFPAERLSEEMQLLDRIGRGESIDHFETVRLCKNGTRIDVSITLSPIFDDNRTIIGASKIARDITSRRFERDRLERLQRLTAALNSGLTVEEIAQLTLTSSAEAVDAEVATLSILSEDGTELVTDHSLGVTPSELAGTRRIPITADFGAAIAIRELRPITLTSEAQHRERSASLRWINPHRGGSRISLPVVWEGRAIAALNLGFAAWGELSAADITYMTTIANQCAQAMQRARAYDAEYRARAVAERSVRLREDMLAVVSHDLRNPLGTVVLVASSLLTDEDAAPPPAQLRKYAKSLQRSADQMTRLIDDLLDLSGIDAGAFKLDRRDHALDSVITEALAMCQPVATERNIRLVADVPDVSVSCDAARTVQVLGNLLSNAIKVTGPGGDVRIDCSLRDDVVVVAVSDTGPGIAAEHLPRIFDRYWRAEQHRYRGAGLGLAIAKGLAEVQGGTIWVESTLGAGSTFSFTLRRTLD